MLVLLKFRQFSSELQGPKKCRLRIGNCNVNVLKSTKHKLHKTWHSTQFQNEHALTFMSMVFLKNDIFFVNSCIFSLEFFCLIFAARLRSCEKVILCAFCPPRGGFLQKLKKKTTLIRQGIHQMVSHLKRVVALYF